MRIIYSCLFYFLLPVILLRLLWRSIKAPNYRRRWHERLAFYQNTYPKNCIWFHAVSLGEAEALIPLVRRLQAQHPEANWLVTTTTPTGSARVAEVLGDSVSHVYLPYDLPDVLGRFLKTFKPKLAVMMETEIWPNLYHTCASHDIPLYLINARLSAKSARGYQKFPALIRPTLAAITHIAAQTPEDAERFINLGLPAEKFSICGNIKFDIELPQALLDQGLALKTDSFGGRFVFICASTHDNEENLLLTVYRQLKNDIPELLLMLAPRHPERFADVAKLCVQQGLAVVERTSGAVCGLGTDVYLADTLGELKMLYAASDIAFIGGSLVPIGGHNLLEAAAAGVPILFGPYMTNFKAISQGILEQSAAIQCQGETALADAVLAMYKNPAARQDMAARAKLFVKQNQGATTRISEILANAIGRIPLKK
jgi:3-deoxy-D-manno-octulosonic-acid transferase